ncbi:MAG: EAL domain-containing protein [Rhodospirillales bacterium]|nr:EAL domain-containing protein [Rhodospirillales bacterium]
MLEVRSTALPDGGFVRTFTDITERRHAQAEVGRLASEDVLTGLPNRRLFQQELEKCAQVSCSSFGAEHQGFALLYLDLDHFKDVNDTLGHPVGDGLLQAVAQRLKQIVRNDSIAARLGGDEFAILIRSVISTDQPEAVAKRLVAALAHPYDIYGQTITIGVSIGIALSPHDATDPDLLLKAADMALYAAKAAGRSTYKFFHGSMAEQVRVRREVEIDLRQAIDKQELELHYQPLLNLATHSISGFEALMRWRHPVRGLVAPADFIPIAEDTGLIVPLGAWAIRTACLEAMNWPRTCKISVNVSSIQFKSGSLVATVRDILAETGLPAGRLELEITETTLLNDSETTFGILRELRELGVKVSLDDFGTGYSSLSYLRTIPLNGIKIDRSFVKDLGKGPGGDVIISSVIDIAKTMAMTTTAEGVETAEQLKLLTTLGCHEAQGFLISKPIPGQQVLDLINSWKMDLVLAA